MQHQSEDGREAEEARTVGPQPRHDREERAFAALARFNLTPAPLVSINDLLSQRGRLFCWKETPMTGSRKDLTSSRWPARRDLSIRPRFRENDGMHGYQPESGYFGGYHHES